MPNWTVVWYRGNERGEEVFRSQESAQRLVRHLESAGCQAFAVPEPTPDDFRFEPAEPRELIIYPTTRLLKNRPPRAVLVRLSGVAYSFEGDGKRQVVAFNYIKDANAFRIYLNKNAVSPYKVRRFPPRVWPSIVQDFVKGGMHWLYIPKDIKPHGHVGTTYRIDESV